MKQMRSDSKFPEFEPFILEFIELDISQIDIVRLLKFSKKSAENYLKRIAKIHAVKSHKGRRTRLDRKNVYKRAFIRYRELYKKSDCRYPTFSDFESELARMLKQYLELDEVCERLNIVIGTMLELAKFRMDVEHKKYADLLNAIFGHETVIVGETEFPASKDEAKNVLIDFIKQSDEQTAPSCSNELFARVSQRFISENIDKICVPVIPEALIVQVEKAISKLYPREQFVIRMRFGFVDGVKHTLREIGRKLNVLAKRIQQIEARAMQKFRRASFFDKDVVFQTMAIARKHMEKDCQNARLLPSPPEIESDTLEHERPPKFYENIIRRVDEFVFSVRIANCLQNSNIRYIGELIQKREWDLLRTRNFGCKSLKEVKETLRDLDLKLETKIPNWAEIYATIED